MRILAISDLHGDFDQAFQATRRLRPDLLVCCGDWGDVGQVVEADLNRFLELSPVVTTFGNHDPLELLRGLRNRDGSPVLLDQGEVREIEGLRFAAIGGIWAKSHRQPYYVTDSDVAEYAGLAASRGPVDILMTHGCPAGLADLTPSGRHGGQRCFLEAFKTIGPRIHLCGHLHVAQQKKLADGRTVINLGATPGGSVVVLEYDHAAEAMTSWSGSVDELADGRAPGR
jgi:Icc-related predicted phosphoesterase